MNIKVQCGDRKSLARQQCELFFFMGPALIPTGSFIIVTVDIKQWAAIVGPTLKDWSLLVGLLFGSTGAGCWGGTPPEYVDGPF